MIAGGDGVGAGLDEFLDDSRGDAKAAGGVLGVDEHEIERQRLAQGRQALEQCEPPGSSDHVAEGGDAHANPFADAGDAAVSPSLRRSERFALRHDPVEPLV